jgi:hypothetical protein
MDSFFVFVDRYKMQNNSDNNNSNQHELEANKNDKWHGLMG